MKPTHYLDFELAEGTDTDVSSTVVANQVIKILHGAFREKKGHYAVSLPCTKPGVRSSTGNVLRIFSGSKESLALLIVNIQNHFYIRDYATIHRIESVPDKFSGEWIEYRRFRISTIKMDRNDSDGKASRKRLQRASELGLPYFIIQSQSNGHRFSLVIEPRKGNSESITIEPDSYGFSVSSRPFSLPAIPLKGFGSK